jgi:amino acid adenylation domain-containing protein
MTANRPPSNGSAGDLSSQIERLSPAQRALLRKRLAEKSPTTSPTIPRRPARVPPPLSFTQERLWLLDQLVPGNVAFNVPRAMRLRGELDVPALQQALDAVLARHEILRTVYTSTGGIPTQVITNSRTVDLVQHDLRGLPPDQREAEAWRLLHEAIERPFDLSSDLMLRAALLRLGEQDHILLLLTHHVASDGWSRGILFAELGALYEAFHAAQPAPLPELPIQYADFAAWERTWLADHLGEHLAYWKERLAGAPELLELPTDRPRPANQSYAGATLSRRLPAGLLPRLQALSNQEGASLFMTFFAGFLALLSRWTGRTDLLAGTPASRRNSVETEPLIGAFLNMLVLRTDLSGDPPFCELLRRVRDVVLGAHEHSDLPFEKLVAELKPTRTASYAPLFQVVFALDQVRGPTAKFAGLSTELLPLQTASANYDLFVTVTEDGQEIQAAFNYATDLFDEATVSRLAGHLGTLLQGAAAHPDWPIGKLPLLSEQESQQLLRGWNDTREEYPAPGSVHGLFEEQARRTPEAVAVEFEGRRLTYAELDARAERLAAHLRSLGVGPGTLIGIHVHRGLDMLVGLLGVLKAGGAYVPLDPSFPRDRLAFMLADAAAPFLLTERRLADALPAHSAHVLELDGSWESQSTQARSASDGMVPSLALRAREEDLAYVLYTSGSTGRPKGVEVTHRSVVNFMRTMGPRLGLGPSDGLLAVTTLSFDIAALELFLPLTVGARVIVLSREAAADGPRLLAELSRPEVTAMQATPATWQLLLESGWQPGKALKVFCGGEALPRALADRLVERSAEVFNLYGPTETTIWSTLARLAPSTGPVSIGGPIGNTQVYLLDARLRLVPPGCTGELYIGGDGLARGYRGRPALTAERFVPDPFSGERGARLYRTGDLARWLPGGALECLGRVDHQVKVRGFRIELGEIETALARHPDIRQAVAVVREDTPGDRRLTAYIVPAPGREPAAKDLRDHLHETLPDYMIPSAFVLLEALPLSPNGKVNRAALPRPQAATQSAEEYVAPVTPVEQALAEIWAAVLGVDKVGARDNFFDRGGHSLLGMQVVARLRDAYQIEVPVKLLFDAPTLADLARIVEQDLVRSAGDDEMAALLADLEDAAEG